MARFTTHGCLVRRSCGGLEAALSGDLGVPTSAEPLPCHAPRTSALCASSPLWAVEGKGRAWLDFANDVTTKDVRLAAQEGYTSVEHMKRYTTQGMAPDQGKNSNLLGAWRCWPMPRGAAIPETGITTFRPPFVPVSVGGAGRGRSQGMGFAPQRFLTSDQASRDRHAPMVEAGLWYRPSYFPKPGEATWRESCDREVEHGARRGGRRRCLHPWQDRPSGHATPRASLIWFIPAPFQHLGRRSGALWVDAARRWFRHG